MLLHGQREVRAALDGRIVGDQDAFRALDDPDAGDDPGRRCLPVVHVPGGQSGELEESAGGVDEPVDPLSGGQFPARPVSLDRLIAAAERDAGRSLAKLGYELLHLRAAAIVLLARLDV